MSTPLLGAVEEYLRKDRARFHMPGHKGLALPVIGQAAAYDITEVEGADSLYEASEAIAETERRYAALYGAAGSFLSAGGSTLCIQAMLALAAPPGSRLLVGRGAHTAAINAMALLDLHPVWLYPDMDAVTGLPMALTAPMVRAALAEQPDILGVYLTSPDYFGTIAEIEQIAAVCCEHHIPLLVDNAHGAHLAFCEPSLHPIRLGADLCADSLHKTLPVLTGGALLHSGSPRFLAGAKRAMALFGSTSPNYLVLLSADAALPYLQTKAAADFAYCAQRIAALKTKASAIGYLLPTGVIDPYRLTLGFGGIGYTSAEFGQKLRACGIEPEYLSDRFCVLMASGFTTAQNFDRLEQALDNIPPRRALAAPPLQAVQHPQKACSLREAALAPFQTLPLEQAIGGVASRAVTPCPPGIPVVVPGEIVDEAVCALLKNGGISHVDVVVYK